MNGKLMWFGTRGREMWVPCPAVNPDYSRLGFEVWSQHLGGGAGGRSSKNAHNAYVLAWGAAKTRDAIRPITDFADGVYDDLDGVNLIYWIDPMAADKNVLNQAWATPSLAVEDARPLVADAYGYRRPGSVNTPTNSYGYPARGAVYTVEDGDAPLDQYIPIPPGFTAWVGLHAEDDAEDYIFVQPVDGYDAVGSPVTLTALGVTTSTRVNASFPSSSSSGIDIYIDPSTPGEFTVYGIIVQILPTGVTPATGGFISGQGHSGCQFRGKPIKTPLSARLDRVSMTATLEETGMWL